MTVDHKVALRKICEKFFIDLQALDMHDHPEVFLTLDKVAREHGLMIHAEQHGIFGTKLFFGRDTDG